MKTTETHLEKASSRNDGSETIAYDVTRVDPITAMLGTHVVVLTKCIVLQDFCSMIGLPLSHVAENSKRSIRANIHSILENLRISASRPYVPGLVDCIVEATEDLLHLDEYITKDNHKAGSNGATQTNPASAVRDAAIEALSAVLYGQAKRWDGVDIEELRQIRIDLCRAGMADSKIPGGSYDETTGQEVLAEDNRGRQLVVVVREPEKVDKKNIAPLKPSKSKA
jgi:hypothetical protein